MYNSIEKQPFRFDTIGIYGKMNKNATDELMPSSNENNNERPIGRKAVKERKKSGKSLLGDTSSLSSAISELKDEKKHTMSK
ncbi:hypothetical protein LIER_19385 [Lithospermum erythrorhizon]|uniref:Uncharacterized protein n=1 Tax=Lithospermum erythrorhizon TaxID=34254 RepID=A0AAV3QLX1_LITER